MRNPFGNISTFLTLTMELKQENYELVEYFGCCIKFFYRCFFCKNLFVKIYTYLIKQNRILLTVFRV